MIPFPPLLQCTSVSLELQFITGCICRRAVSCAIKYIADQNSLILWSSKHFNNTKPHSEIALALACANGSSCTKATVTCNSFCRRKLPLPLQFYEVCLENERAVCSKHLQLLKPECYSWFRSVAESYWNSVWSWLYGWSSAGEAWWSGQAAVKLPTTSRARVPNMVPMGKLYSFPDTHMWGSCPAGFLNAHWRSDCLYRLK